MHDKFGKRISQWAMLATLLIGLPGHAQDGSAGATLRARILHEYAELTAQHRLSPNPQANDISAMVEQTIRPGMRFDEAVQILRDAGLNPVSAPRLKNGIPEDDNSRFLIFAGMLLEQRFLGHVDVHLVVYPKVEQEKQMMVVGRVRCTFNSSSL